MSIIQEIKRKVLELEKLLEKNFIDYKIDIDIDSNLSMEDELSNYKVVDEYPGVYKTYKITHTKSKKIYVTMIEETH